MNNSTLISYTKISPHRTSPRTHEIDTITIHCYVGQVSVEDMGHWFASATAKASCNYAIGSDGRIALIVDEADRSWCSSNGSNDHRAVTIECASDKTDPYAINSKVYASLIRLCADICKRNGIKKLLWQADKSLVGQVAKQNMTAHRWFANKACPGDYIYNRLGQIAAEVNAQLGASQDTVKIWLGWTKRESGSAGYRQTNGDSGRAYGKYQFDYRYALVPFLQYCLGYNSDRYAGFKTFIGYGAGSASLIKNAYLAEQWLRYCDAYPAEFEALQDRYAYQAYYVEAAKYMQNLHGIDLADHSPALRGSVYSMAIRSGALNAARRYAGYNNTSDDATMMRAAYATYGTEDAGRWTEQGQLGDALDALAKNTYTVIRISGSLDHTADILPDTNEPWYRVRKSWSDAKGQIGAYHDLAKAKACADANPGYTVYDDIGKAIYPTTTQYIVQAGVFTGKANADKLAARLKAAGFDAIVKSDGGQYRVQCGVFASADNAAALARQLKTAGFDAVIK